MVASVANGSDEPHESELVTIRWQLVRQSWGKPDYYYRDAGRLLDLFSYHAQDSNRGWYPQRSHQP